MYCVECDFQQGCGRLFIEVRNQERKGGRDQGITVYLYCLVFFSESSMFVYPHKMILKTCGTTTLLLAVSRLLEIAKNYCGFEKVWRVFYSRKAFMFPERQLGPHRSWDDEVKFLDKYFGKCHVSVYSGSNGVLTCTKRRWVFLYRWQGASRSMAPLHDQAL